MNRTRPENRRFGKQAAEVAEQTKRDILEAGLQCFATKGFNSTTLRDIAEQANISHGLLRHHFGSKNDLWKACVAFVAAQVGEVQSSVLDQVTPENAVESFEKVIRTFISYAAQYPTLWRMLAFEALKDSSRLDYIFQVVWPIHTRIASLFKSVQEQGYFRDFTNDSFFLFVVQLGAMPFALAPFSNKLCGVNILSEKQREEHADLVINTLFRQQR